MYSKIKILGYSLLPMLLAYPMVFYTTTLAGYIAYNSNQDIFCFKVAYVANLAGIIMAAVAAIPGFIDWLHIPSGLKPKKTALIQLISHVTALVLFVISFFIQRDKWDEPNPAVGGSIGLTALAFVVTLIAGFLAGGPTPPSPAE